MDSNLESEIRGKCIVSLEQILSKCDDFDVLEKLLIPSIPTEIMINILDKISKVFFSDLCIIIDVSICNVIHLTLLDNHYTYDLLILITSALR